MAFGALTQSGEQSADYNGGTSTIAVTLTGTVADSLLVGRYFTGATDYTIDTSGYAEDVDLVDAGNTDSGVITGKTSAGGDQTLTISSSVGEESVLFFAEYEGAFDATPLDKVASTAVATATSISSGTTATTTVADELIVVLITERSNTDAGVAWSNSFVDSGAGHYQTGDPPGTQGAKGIYVGQILVTGTGAYESTGSSINNVPHMAGIATYKKASAAGGLGIPLVHYDHQRRWN